MTNEELKRDAARYWRLRVLGCAPCETKQLENGTVLRFSNLDEFIDHDIKIRPSRGEAEIYENKTEGAAVSASPQPSVQAILKEFVAKYARLNGVREQLATPKYDHYVEGASDFADELETQFFAAAPAQEPLRKLVTDKEPNGYPLWFNRAVYECHVCDSEDLCRKHLEMAERDFTGCEQEVELFLDALTHKSAAQEQPVENSPQEKK